MARTNSCARVTRPKALPPCLRRRQDRLDTAQGSPRLTALAKLWKDGLLSDMRVQLCTTQVAGSTARPAQATSGEQLPQPSTSMVGIMTEPTGSRAKAARHSLSNSSAPASVTAAAALAAAAAAIAAAAAAVAGADSTQHQDSSDSVTEDSTDTGGADVTSDDGDCTFDSSRTFQLHAAIVASFSGYFKARLAGRGSLNYSGNAGIAASAAAHAQVTATAGVLLVEYVEDGELDAMEAVLRHCYTGKLRDADAAMPSMAKLLKMMALADRFDVQYCMEACCEELAEYVPEAYTIPGINTILAAAPPGWAGLASYEVLEYHATERLMDLLGDFDAVAAACCYTSGGYSIGGGGGSSGGGADVKACLLKATLLELNLPSLLALLRSDTVFARSENCVCMVAHVWMSGAAGVARSAAERQRVAATLRLSQLSLTFLRQVVSQLPWLGVSVAQLEALLVQLRPAASPSSPAARPVELEAGLCPAAWSSAVPRQRQPGVGGLLWTWSVPWEQVGPLLAEAGRTGERQTLLSPGHFLDGFTVHLMLSVDPETEAAEGGAPKAGAGRGRGAHVGHVVTIGTGDSSISFQSVHMVAECGVMEKGALGGQYTTREVCGDLQSGADGSMCLHLARIPAAQVLDSTAWDAYLVGGGLQLKSLISLCS